MQATAAKDKAVYNAVRNTVREVLTANNMRIYKIFCDARTSNQKCNIAGQHCKAYVAKDVSDEILQQLNAALAKYNCCATLHTVRDWYARRYVKILRLS